MLYRVLDIRSGVECIFGNRFTRPRLKYADNSTLFVFYNPNIMLFAWSWANMEVVRDTNQRILLWSTIHVLIVVHEAETQFLDVDHVAQYIVRDVPRDGGKEEKTS